MTQTATQLYQRYGNTPFSGPAKNPEEYSDFIAALGAAVPSFEPGALCVLKAMLAQKAAGAASPESACGTKVSFEEALDILASSDLGLAYLYLRKLGNGDGASKSLLPAGAGKGLDKPKSPAKKTAKGPKPQKPEPKKTATKDPEPQPQTALSPARSSSFSFKPVLVGVGLLLAGIAVVTVAVRSVRPA